MRMLSCLQTASSEVFLHTLINTQCVRVCVVVLALGPGEAGRRSLGREGLLTEKWPAHIHHQLRR